MADDPNIDDILKSIDALLKEGEADDGRGDRDKRHRAINDDEVGEDMEATSAEMPDDDQQASQDDQQLDDLHQDEQHQAELQQAADAADMDDHPTNLSPEADEGEEGVPVETKPAARRIVLSEDMLVESTPDLPLTFTEDDDQTDERLEEERSEDEQLEDEQAAIVHDGDEETMGAERRVEQISMEINARLQAILPGLVAEVVRKHMDAPAGASGFENDDAADADGD